MNPDDPLTTAPPHPEHVFLCPSCECALDHVGDRTSGDTGDVTEMFRCPSGCGSFEHERRTRRLRLVDGSAQSPQR